MLYFSITTTHRTLLMTENHVVSGQSECRLSAVCSCCFPVDWGCFPEPFSWLEYPLSMFESGRRKHLCAVYSHTTFSYLHSSSCQGPVRNPGSQAHLKLPNVLTHLCSQPPLSGFRHSSSSDLITRTQSNIR